MFILRHCLECQKCAFEPLSISCHSGGDLSHPGPRTNMDITNPFLSILNKRSRTQVDFATKERIAKRIKDTPNKRGLVMELAKEFNLPHSTISAIKKNHEEILRKCEEEIPSLSTIRLRDAKFPELERALSFWLEDKLNYDLQIPDEILLTKSKELAQCLGISKEEFKASTGWLANFKKRFNVHLSKVQNGVPSRLLPMVAFNSETLSSLLNAASCAYGNQPAIIVCDGGPRVTHSELQKEVDRVASILVSLGIKAGDIVSLSFPNTLEFVVLFLAITRARAVAAPLNSAYTEEEFKFFMQDAESRLLILPEKGGSKAAEAAANSLQIPVASVLSWSQGGIEINLYSTQTIIASVSDAALPPPEPSDEALFLHTSGTTGKPKGVPLSHSNLSASIYNIINTYDLNSFDRSYIVMPLFHVHGLMAALLSTLTAGGTAVLPAGGRFSASAFWNDIKESGVTWYTAVPTIHQILLSRHKNKPEGGGTYPLRFIRSCSSSLAPAILTRLEDEFKAPVLEAYAMTEASHQMTSNPLPKHGPHKLGCVGKPTGIELAILDLEGNLLPSGSPGEVCIRGKNVTVGYKNNPKANEEAFAFGWFHTGDQGIVDEDGYLSLTGRIKELINRGGEKISPTEIDSALLSHPSVAEAVCFGVHDDHYGEEVNAAVVLHKGLYTSEIEIQKFLKNILAVFKIPKKILFVSEFPRTATGKIQRKIVAKHFEFNTESVHLQNENSKLSPDAVKIATLSLNPTPKLPPSTFIDGSSLVSLSLHKMGLKQIFGVVGIPVTQIAMSAVQAGVRFLGFRNEQAAGFAAGASGYISEAPGVLLTVSGPGFVNGLAGLSNATVNTWPMLLLSGSCSQEDFGKGDFQELDQVAAAKPFAKFADKARKIEDIPGIIQTAVVASLQGRPGGVYVDLPTDILHQTISSEKANALLSIIHPISSPLLRIKSSDPALIKESVNLLKNASRPLIVLGKGAAYGRAEDSIKNLIETYQLPFLPTPMAKGLLRDDHPLSAMAARSLALSECDVAMVIGARLNWVLHFGQPPKWNNNVKFILVDVDQTEIELRKVDLGLVGDASTVVNQLLNVFKENPFDQVKTKPWIDQIKAKSESNSKKMEILLQKDVTPLNFHCSLRIIRDAILAAGSPAPFVISEGANTMDVGRTVVLQTEPRTRLDAGTWGTMGVGLGYSIAAAVNEPERVVIAIEGDSAFGFSGMELETIVRYNLPIIVVVMNNNGVYGGDRRESSEIIGPYKLDPSPTSFVNDARYDLVMEAFGGKGYYVSTTSELQFAINFAIKSRKPSLINVKIDPMAGSESGRLAHKN